MDNGKVAVAGTDEQYVLYCIEIPYQKLGLYWYWLIFQNSAIPIPNQYHNNNNNNSGFICLVMCSTKRENNNKQKCNVFKEFPCSATIIHYHNNSTS